MAATNSISLKPYQFQKLENNQLLVSDKNGGIGIVSYAEINDENNSLSSIFKSWLEKEKPVHIFVKDSFSHTDTHVSIKVSALQSAIESRAQFAQASSKRANTFMAKRAERHREDQILKADCERDFEEVSNELDKQPLVSQGLQDSFRRQDMLTQLEEIDLNDQKECELFYEQHISDRITPKLTYGLFSHTNPLDSEQKVKVVQEMKTSLDDFKTYSKILSQEGDQVAAYLSSREYDVLDLMLHQATVRKGCSSGYNTIVNFNIGYINTLHRFPAVVQGMALNEHKSGKLYTHRD